MRLTSFKVFVSELIFIDLFEPVEVKLSYKRFDMSCVEKLILFAQAKVLEEVIVKNETLSILGPFNCKIQSCIIDHLPQFVWKNGFLMTSSSGSILI